MGIVYEARDPDLGRLLAVKVTWGSRDPQRQLDEARLAAQLNHPNVVTVHDAGRVRDGVFVLHRRTVWYNNRVERPHAS